MKRTTDLSMLHGVAVITWALRAETPLCIKSGTISAYKDKQVNFGTKLRDKDKEKDKNSESTVSDFYFDAAFNDAASPLPEAVFRIPASSVRGALRNYTIRRLIPKDMQNAALFEKVDDEEQRNATMEKQKNRLKKALNEPGWRLIQNLFGFAADVGDEDDVTVSKEDRLENETVAGRLQVICDDVIMKVVDLDLEKKDCPIYVVPRSPLDRVTRGTKEHGLHNFMELKPGYEFKVLFRLLNPTPEDLGFFTFWEKSVNQGLIRLGGLSGVGKGRLKVMNADVRLYTRSPKDFQLPENDSPESDHSMAADVLSTVMPEHVIPWQEKKNAYLEKLVRHFDELKRRN